MVFDIPLLYETKAEQQLDVVLVVSAPADVQRQRVLVRPGMTPEKLAAILARQVCWGLAGKEPASMRHAWPSLFGKRSAPALAVPECGLLIVYDA